MKKRFTIEDYANGKVQCLNDGALEQLQKLNNLAFPEDKVTTKGRSKYYFQAATNSCFWKCDDLPIHNTPIQSVKDFFIEEEKTFPRVMLVSETNDIKNALPRVVIKKVGNIIVAWENAETIEEAEKVTRTALWEFAWEIEEKPSITFPFEITAEQGQRIVDVLEGGEKLSCANCWGVEITLKQLVSVSEEVYTRLISNASDSQKEVLNDIFK